MATPHTSHCKRGHERTPENRAVTNGQCIVCKREYSKVWRKANPQYKKQWRSKHKQRLRLEHINSRYGLDMAGYKEMYANQGGRCAICTKTFDASNTKLIAQIDHDHTTGMVRGLLCRRCNVALGNLDDDRDRLLTAIYYLEQPPAAKEVPAQ